MYNFHHIIVIADTSNKMIARIDEPTLDKEQWLVAVAVAVEGGDSGGG